MELLSYPTHQDYRGGNKVSWYIFTSEKDAKQASKVARHNARILEARGYDWGYCSPGFITKLPDGRFEVCIP